MPLADLTTPAAIRAYASIDSSGASDLLLASLASSASRMCLNYINRSILVKTSFVELYDGNGREHMQLMNYPVSQVTSLIINGITIKASTSPATNTATPQGYWLEAADLAPPGTMQSVYLYGYCFTRGVRNIAITYIGGYFVNGETQTPATNVDTVTVDQPYGPWSSDLGVTYSSSGTALTAVKTAPTTGQYQLDADNPGNYIFAAGDNGVAMSISYNYTPFDLFQAATELAAERYSYRTRIGKTSASIGGQETTAFNLKMPDAIKMVLNQYRNVTTY